MTHFKIVIWIVSSYAIAVIRTVKHAKEPVIIVIAAQRTKQYLKLKRIIVTVKTVMFSLPIKIRA